MARLNYAAAATVLASALPLALAQSCPTTLTPTHSIQPSVASGYTMALVATGLTSPRSIEFDTDGNLLVVEAGAGITNLVLQDNGGTCVTVKSSKRIVQNTGVSGQEILYRNSTNIPFRSSTTAWLCLRTGRRSTGRPLVRHILGNTT